jgi:hypothetical protein
MLTIKIRKISRGRVEFRDRKDEGAQHPRFRDLNVFSKILQGRLQREVRRREKSRVIDGARQKSAK